MRMFLKHKRPLRTSEEVIEEIAKRLAADAKIEYPKGTRFRILDESILTREGHAATRNGVLNLDAVSVSEPDYSTLAKVG